MALGPSLSTRTVFVLAAALFLVVGAVSVGGGATTQDDSSTEITQSFTIDLGDFPADGESRSLYVTVPDAAAGTVSVDSLDASGSGITVDGARVVDGPDDDGQLETVLVTVGADGGGTVSGSVGVTVSATIPEMSQEEAESIAVGGVSGSVEYTVDDSDPLFQSAIENYNNSLTSLASAESVLAVTPPEGVAVESVSASVSTEELSLSVPLERIERAIEASVGPSLLVFEEGTTTRTVSVTSTATGTLTVESATASGNDSAFEVSGVPDTVAPGETAEVTVEHVGSGGEGATLTIRTDARNLPEASVDLSATARTDEENDEPVETVEPDGLEVTEREGETRINVTVRNVSSGQSVSMSMPEDTSDEGSDVAIENMSMTAATDGNFNVSIRTGPNVSESMPEMDTSDKEPLGFFGIEHSWDNENVSRATVTVRVEKSRVDSLEDTDPDEVVLLRHVGDGWGEERTEFVGETETHYRFRVVSTGYSDWATAGKQPDFQIVETALNVTSSVEVDDPVGVTVRIENDGEADGDYETTLWLNDVKIDSREVSIAPGGTGQVLFERTLNQAGTYEVRVNNVTVDQIEVEGPVDSQAQTDGDSGNGDGSGSQSGDATTADTGGDGDDGIPAVLIAGGLALAAVVVGVALYFRSADSADPHEPPPYDEPPE
jgi:PGF-pre-PGF domain-containing protein